MICALSPAISVAVAEANAGPLFPPPPPPPPEPPPPPLCCTVPILNFVGAITALVSPVASWPDALLPQHHLAKQAKPVTDDFEMAILLKFSLALGSKPSAELAAITTSCVSRAFADPAICPLELSPQHNTDRVGFAAPKIERTHAVSAPAPIERDVSPVTPAANATTGTLLSTVVPSLS